MSEYVLYGAPGWGSTLTEAMLTLCRAPFRFEDVEGFDKPGPERDKLLTLNPNVQVPTLVLPDGEVMTESAAIALLLAEMFPVAGLAPTPGSKDRAHFLRRLIWLGGSLYPTFTYGDYPERFTTEDAKTVRGRIIEYRKTLWRGFEAELDDGPWALGETFTALDIYIAVMTRWRPNRPWFAAECPKLHAIAVRADELEPLKAVWKRNFPD